MMPFDFSARYYDLLYADKDYVGEARYVDSLIQSATTSARARLLDLGCGTGAYSATLQDLGYDVLGVDISGAMLSRARERHPSLTVVQGDVRSVRLRKNFDAITSLFHVASYQTTNEDFLQFLGTIRVHLAPGGIAVFDCWHGPGVLTSRPAVRVKRIEDDKIRVLRVAEPEMFAESNTVNVNYQILIEDKESGVTSSLNESHLMRYFFLPEIKAFLDQSGLRLVDAREWMTGDAPSFDSWSLSVVAAIR